MERCDLNNRPWCIRIMVPLTVHCGVCLDTKQVYRTESRKNGWVAIFEDCPKCSGTVVPNVSTPKIAPLPKTPA